MRQRVRDGVLLRLIGKWLNAGVMEDGAIEYPEAGHAAGWGDFAAAWRTSTCTRCWIEWFALAGRSATGSAARFWSATRMMVRHGGAERRQLWPPEAAKLRKR